MPAATASPAATATYEGMFILDSSRYSAGPEAAASEVLGLLQRVGGEVLASRPWQDTKLAYSINGNRKGVYFLPYFTLETQKLKELDRLVKLTESVLRHLILKLDPALVTPMADGRTPIDVFLDAFADVNRTEAGSGAPLTAEDYRQLLVTARDFLTDETRGLEQIYAIIENRARE